MLESISFSATNGTFVAKSDIESNFSTTPTEEPKLNHWVNTTLNQLVIQFELSRINLHTFLGVWLLQTCLSQKSPTFGSFLFESIWKLEL